MQHEYCLYSDVTWSKCYDMRTKYGDFWDKSCPNAEKTDQKICQNMSQQICSRSFLLKLYYKKGNFLQ